MASKADAVTWPQFAIIVGIAIVVLGGGLTWMHSDVSDVKTSLSGINTNLTDIKTQIATTNGKLDILIDETRKRR